MRGRKAKPLNIAQGEGDTRKLGARKFAAKVATDVDGERLTHAPELQGDALVAWDCWTDYLKSRDMDRQSDAPALLLGCLAYAAAKEGRFNATAARVAISVAAEFGGTPASRAREGFAGRKDGPMQKVKKIMADLSAPRGPKASAVQ